MRGQGEVWGRRALGWAAVAVVCGACAGGACDRGEGGGDGGDGSSPPRVAARPSPPEARVVEGGDDEGGDDEGGDDEGAGARVDAGAGDAEGASHRGAGGGAAAAPVGLKARPVLKGCALARTAPPKGVLRLERMFAKHALDSAVDMVQDPLESNIWYVIGRRGQVWRLDAQDQDKRPTLFADLSDYNVGAIAHGGLLGLAFSPKFREDRTVFMFFTPFRKNVHLTSRLSRFRVGDDGKVDRGTEEEVLVLRQKSNIHKGGHIEFGPGGYLYVAIGDDVFDDPENRSQSLRSLKGKMLRLDVLGEARPYGIPEDNPFVRTPNARPEIWALGLRNPWRFSFDRATGELWSGDVGHKEREELNLMRKGGNYGWPWLEGTRCNRPRNAAGCERPELIKPLYEYTHKEGMSVTGGYVYRGAQMPDLVGTYVFSDFVTGVLWGLSRDPETRAWTRKTLLKTSAHVASFAEDREGELYVVDFGSTDHNSAPSKIWRVRSGADDPGDAIPGRLSETGCATFTQRGAREAPGLEAAEGFVPYAPNVPFWSDGASKHRWLAVPEGAAIQVAEDGDWDMPPGSVLMKHFRLGRYNVETRFMVRYGDGSWGSMSYAWRPDQRDAELVREDSARLVMGTKWIYPSRSQCFACHTEAAGRSLGLETAQLNRDMVYGEGEAAVNQLTALASVGMLALPEALGDVSKLPRMTPPDAPEATAEENARNYLHTNCAMCHRPGPITQVGLDLRRGTALSEMGLCDLAPSFLVPGYAHTRLVSPGSPARSLLWQRMRWRGGHGMPPLGSSKADQEGLGWVGEWISGLEACPSP